MLGYGQQSGGMYPTGMQSCLYFKHFTPFVKIRSNSPMPSDMKTTVPRIKETDIQVMNDVVGKGKFGNVNRGFIKKGTRNTEVAFKTLRGKGLFTSSVSGSPSVNAWKDFADLYPVPFIPHISSDACTEA